MDVVTLALAKKYADNKVGELGKVFIVKGILESKDQLPATGNENGDVYLVGPYDVDGSYDEYFWNGAVWDLMGKSYESSIIKGENPPAASQKASFIGQLYIDKIENRIYQCTNIDGDVVTWVKLITYNDLTVMTQAQYDALPVKDEGTFYYIEEE